MSFAWQLEESWEVIVEDKTFFGKDWNVILCDFVCDVDVDVRCCRLTRIE